MNSQTPKIPTAVAATISLLIFGFLFDAAYGLHALFNAEAQAPSTLPTWYRIMNAVMSMVIGIVYLWLVRMIYTRHPIARILVISIGTANIMFSLTRIPSGLVPLTLNLVILGLVSLKESRDWFDSTL